MNYKPGDFPVTEKIASEIVSLPMFPQLTAAQQARVAREILAFTGKSESLQELTVGSLASAERIN